MNLYTYLVSKWHILFTSNAFSLDLNSHTVNQMLAYITMVGKVIGAIFYKAMYDQLCEALFFFSSLVNNILQHQASSVFKRNIS